MKKREWLINLRRSKQLTQEQVASRSFINRSYYSHIENGQRDPSFIVAENIAKTLNLDPLKFFKTFYKQHTSHNNSIDFDLIRRDHGAHILYTFDNQQNYLDNLLAFVKSSIDNDYLIILIEDSSIYNLAMNQIKQLYSKEEQLFIRYIDNYSFYHCYKNFRLSSMLDYFGKVFEPLLKTDKKINTWSHIEWEQQADFPKKLREFEEISDIKISNREIMGVCAYNAQELSASLQTTLMRSHEYFLTDNELVRSSLYQSGTEGESF